MPGRGSGNDSGRKRSAHDNEQHQLDQWTYWLIISREYHFRRFLGLPPLHTWTPRGTPWRPPLNEGELVYWATTTLEQLGEPYEGEIPSPNLGFID